MPRKYGSARALTDTNPIRSATLIRDNTGRHLRAGGFGLTALGWHPSFFCYFIYCMRHRRHPSVEAVKNAHRSHDQQWSNTKMVKPKKPSPPPLATRRRRRRRRTTWPLWSGCLDFGHTMYLRTRPRDGYRPERYHWPNLAGATTRGMIVKTAGWRRKRKSW